MNKTLIAGATFSLVVGAGLVAFFAQHGASPYRGLESREVKALSASDIAGLRDGLGLGYALTAELNGYPGPRHVLELAQELKLEKGQVDATSQLFQQMKAEASALGQDLIAAETELDRIFSAGGVNVAELRAATERAAVIEGKLRAAHLSYHVAMIDVLQPWQVTRYTELRGYDAQGNSHSGHN